MKICSKCGNGISDTSDFCPSCGFMIEDPIGDERPEEDEEYEEYGEYEYDEISVGLCILAVLIPLFGFIYWAVKHPEAPRRARACGISALIAFGFNLIVLGSFFGA